MGLGKTATVLALLQHEHLRPPGKGGTKRASGGAWPTLVICPTSVAGNWARESERFTPELSVMMHHGATRSREATFEKLAAAADIVITTYALATRDRAVLAKVPLAAHRLRRGPEREEPRGQADQSRPLPFVTPQGRAHRHPGREPPRRAVVDHGDTQPCTPRVGGVVPGAFRDPDRAVPGRRGGGEVAVAHPTLHSAATQDRPDHRPGPAGEDGDERAVHPHQGTGHALPGGGGRHVAPHRGGRGHRPQGSGPDRHVASQAGLQPSRPIPERRLRSRRSLGQTGARRGNPRRGARLGRAGTGVHPVLRDGLPPRRVSFGPVRLPDLLSPRRGAPPTSATSWWRSSRIRRSTSR